MQGSRCGGKGGRGGGYRVFLVGLGRVGRSVEWSGYLGVEVGKAQPWDCALNMYTC